jgi:hypothetical protein
VTRLNTAEIWHWYDVFGIFGWRCFVAISDELAEKLIGLDNFQRAEFLRRREIHSECKTHMSEISSRTSALHQKRLNDASRYSKGMHKLGWFVVVVAMLEGIFDTMPPIWDACACIVALGGWSFFSLKRLMEDNHDEMVFEMLALERARYEHEQRVNSYLNPAHEDNEELVREILNCLGIHNGLVGGGLKIHPLDPVK